ncbi:unnamed protein product [Nezara viridula]|uniref:Uncharacterized protein n=1 Tax=Nezara viridula TaxID=85310 RepID=A0A9P0H7G4_NEZVI|nr:unnamed protein product [Nezara viridula]
MQMPRLRAEELIDSLRCGSELEIASGPPAVVKPPSSPVGTLSRQWELPLPHCPSTLCRGILIGKGSPSLID